MGSRLRSTHLLSLDSRVRQTRTARALGANTSGVSEKDGDELLADTMIGYFKRFQIPNGLRAVGFSGADILKLVEGTQPQLSVTKLSSRPADLEELVDLFRGAMQYLVSCGPAALEGGSTIAPL